MSLREEDIEAALTAESMVDVPTERLIERIHRGATRRRHTRALMAVAGVVTVGVATAAVALAPGWLDRPTPTADEPTASPSSSTAPVVFTGSCTISDLPLPPSVAALGPAITVDITPRAMDTTGRFVVASYEDQDHDILIVWDNGVPSLLPTPDPAHLNMWGRGVNRLGTVVGTTTSLDSTSSAAWTYADGQFHALVAPEGYGEPAAFAINDAGEVVGSAANSSGLVAVRWSADGTPRVLDSPDGAIATDIAADGTVVGSAQLSDDIGSTGRPYVWAPDGTGRFLPTPHPDDLGDVQQVRGEWALGQIMEPGATHDNKILFHSTENVLWNLRTGQWSTWDVNDLAAVGWVNANGDTLLTHPAGRQAELVRDGQIYLLPTQVAPGASYPVIYQPLLASDDATVIVGRSYLADGWSGVIWRC